MSASVLQKLREDLRSGVQPGSDEESLVFFGFLRGIQDREVMLEFRRTEEDREAFAYALLTKIDLKGNGEIILHFVGYRVTVTGRNLHASQAYGAQKQHAIRLYDALRRHRVNWIRTATPEESFTVAEDALFVEVIDIQRTEAG